MANTEAYLQRFQYYPKGTIQPSCFVQQLIGRPRYYLRPRGDFAGAGLGVGRGLLAGLEGRFTGRPILGGRPPGPPGGRIWGGLLLGRLGLWP